MLRPGGRHTWMLTPAWRRRRARFSRLPYAARVGSWADDAVVHRNALVDAVCARCDEPLFAGEQAASVPGLNARGWAHSRCLTETVGRDQADQEGSRRSDPA
jgi:hypothetical protein